MEETTYHTVADRCLTALLDQIETQDETGEIEADIASGVLTIELPTGKQFVISKHAINRELWLSSPVSGGLHFRHVTGQWRLTEGTTLHQVLSADLSQLAGKPFSFTTV